MALYRYLKKEVDDLPSFSDDRDYDTYLHVVGHVAIRLGGCSDPRFTDDITVLLEKVRISDQSCQRLGPLPATVSEHYPPLSRSNTRQRLGPLPATLLG